MRTKAPVALSAVAMLALLVQPLARAAAPEVTWRSLQPGVDYAVIAEGQDGRGPVAAEPLHVVRIEPGRAPMVAAMASAGDRRSRTAGKWCREKDLVVAINLGMYATDMLTNVGHAHAPGHVNNARWPSSYKSALGFAPTRKKLPAAVMVDLDTPGAKQQLADYGGVVQNLRLIRAPGQNVWSKQARRWSEAAVAMDRQGRVLFLFTRRQHSMHELNAKLLALPLAITHAMHVEGGHQASLSIHGGGIDLDLGGGYATGSDENDGEPAQWPIPNVLGVARR